MKYLAAYLLAGIGGKAEPSVGDLEKILGSVGIECEKQNAETLVKLLNGKDINEVIGSGLSKLASVPSGAPAAAGPASASGTAAPAASTPAKEEKKKEEPKEESDEDMGFGLFD